MTQQQSAWKRALYAVPFRHKQPCKGQTMRVDIFLRVTDETRLYVQAVTQANAKNIIAALERDGEEVIVCRHSKGALGKFVYQTERGQS